MSKEWKAKINWDQNNQRV